MPASEEEHREQTGADREPEEPAWIPQFTWALPSELLKLALHPQSPTLRGREDWTKWGNSSKETNLPDESRKQPASCHMSTEQD